MSRADQEGGAFAGTTIYFDAPGPANTEAASEAALRRAAALGLKDIVVASNTGASAKVVLDGLTRPRPGPRGGTHAPLSAETGARLGAETEAPLGGYNLVVVTHHVGFHGPGQDEMAEAVRAELAAAGAKLLTTTHLFGGVERAVIRQFGGMYPGGLIANTLRLFGEGTKVAVEVSVMALDAGLVPHGRDVVALGGTGRGSDTALIVRPAHANSFFETRIVEVICRPRPKC